MTLRLFDESLSGNPNRAAAMSFAVRPPLYRYELIAPVTGHGAGHGSGPRLRIGDRRRADRPRSPGRRRCAHRRRIGGRAPTIGGGGRPRWGGPDPRGGALRRAVA